MITLQERVYGVAPPTDWALAKLHRVLRVRKGRKNVGMQEDNLLSLSYGRIVRKDIDSAEGLLPESFETYQIVEPGNIVMRLTDLQNDKRSLRQGLVRERGIITSAYDALEIDQNSDPRFWAYALLALDQAKYYYSLGGGVRQSIKFADFPNDWIAVPDLSSQRVISDYLDKETNLVDQLIEKKRRLIDLIAAKRAALLTATIAGSQLSSDDLVATDSSWFPKIPKGSRLTRLKEVATKISDGPHISPEYVDEGIPFISARNVKVDGWQLDDAKFISDQLYRDLCRKSKPQIGDVLYTKGGTTGVARAVDLDFEFHIWVHIALIQLRKKLANPFYIAYALNSSACYDQSQLYTRGATNNDLGLNRMCNIQFPLPGLNRQKEIVQYLDGATGKLDKAKARVEASVHALTEFRAALIAEAVTGQLDLVALIARNRADSRPVDVREAMRA